MHRRMDRHRVRSGSPMRKPASGMLVRTVAAGRRPPPPQSEGEKRKLTRTHGPLSQTSERPGKENAMVRHALLGLAAAALVGTAFIPDDASAHSRGARAGAVKGSRAQVSRPAAKRGVAYRAGASRGAVRGAAGAAAGAAAVGAGYYGGDYYGGDSYGAGYYGGDSFGAGYPGNSCYRDSRGRVVCPNPNQYQYGY
jgi:hypothetical protein